MHFAQGILILDAAEHLKDKWILLEQYEIIFLCQPFVGNLNLEEMDSF